MASKETGLELNDVGPTRRWEDNITMDLQEVVCAGMDWIELAQDRDRLRANIHGINLLPLKMKSQTNFRREASSFEGCLTVHLPHEII